MSYSESMFISSIDSEPTDESNETSFETVRKNPEVSINPKGKEVVGHNRLGKKIVCHNAMVNKS